MSYLPEYIMIIDLYSHILYCRKAAKRDIFAQSITKKVKAYGRASEKSSNMYLSMNYCS